VEENEKYPGRQEYVDHITFEEKLRGLDYFRGMHDEGTMMQYVDVTGEYN
jgi:hypothetical protein